MEKQGINKKSKYMILLLIIISAFLLAGCSIRKPPDFSIFTPNAPADMTITLHFTDGNTITPNKERIILESFFAFFNVHDSESDFEALCQCST